MRSTTSRDVTSRSVRLLTTVDPNGQETTIRFEYGRTTSYGAFSDRVNVGAGDSGVPVSINLDSLRPNTRYHYRAVATNETGTHPQPRPLVPDDARADRHQHRADPEPRRLGRRPDRDRPLRGSALGGTRVALERQGFPFRSGFNEVGTTHGGPHGHVPLQLSARCSRPRSSASSRGRAGPSRARSARRRARCKRRRPRALARPPPGAHRGRDLAAGAAGRVSLQKRSPRGRWAVVRRAGAEGARREPLALPLHRAAREAPDAVDATASWCWRATAARTCPGAAVRSASRRRNAASAAGRRRRCRSGAPRRRGAPRGCGRRRRPAPRCRTRAPRPRPRSRR